MTRVLSLETDYERAFEEAKKVLASGGILIYPTDTVYGIGGDARKKEVVELIRKIKKKGESPFSALFGGIEMVREYAVVDGDSLKAVMEVFPGATTLILKAKKELPIVQNGKIGIRVPEHIFMRKLSLALGMPILTTSANLSGENAPVCLKDVDEAVLEKADLAIDGGKTLHAMPSTIVDVVDKKVLRVGVGEIVF